MAGENVIGLTEENWEQEVEKSDSPVLVDFWAPWCGPCRMVGPIVEELAGEYQGKVRVGKLNTDEAPNIAAKFGIRSIPTLMIFKGGQVADQLVGAYPKSKISEKLDAAIA